MSFARFNKEPSIIATLLLCIFPFFQNVRSKARVWANFSRLVNSQFV